MLDKLFVPYVAISSETKGLEQEIAIADFIERTDSMRATNTYYDFLGEPLDGLWDAFIACEKHDCRLLVASRDVLPIAEDEEFSNVVIIDEEE